ncbi:hypothetical protein AB1N83_005295 [Pleurotus pulmonarius]
MDNPQPTTNSPSTSDEAEASLALHKVMNSHLDGSNDIGNTDIQNPAVKDMVAQGAGGSLQSTLRSALLATLPDALTDVLPAALPADVVAALPAALDAVLPPALAPITTRLNELELAHGKMRRIVARDSNTLHGDTLDAVLEVVPFANGQDPTLAPHSLPAITSLRALEALSADDRDYYFVHYCPDAEARPAVAERKRLIASALGVMNYSGVPPREPSL